MDVLQVAQVRAFNRLVTQRSGALNDHFLGRDRPLAASRLLFEIGPDGADLRDLRARLGLDSGYLSRLIQTLVGAGLVTLQPGSDDDRVRRAELTQAGLAEVEEIDRRSNEAAVAILSPLTERQRERLVTAMADVCRLLRSAAMRIERVDPSSREASWCLTQYFAELDRRFEHGFDPGQVLPIDEAELRPPQGAVLVATIDGEPVACSSLKTIGPGIGYLKRMWVAESVRGMGLSKRLLAAMETEARQLGMHTLRLETNRALVEAIRLYRQAGYADIPPFNDEPYADYWFEKQLA